MKKILFVLFFLLIVGFIGFACADDLQVSTISVGSNPVANQTTNVHTEVILRDANASVSTSVDVDYGNSIVKSYSMTLTPNLLYSIDEPIIYASSGNYVISATIDPLNLINDSNVGNNVLQRTITVTAPVIPPAPVISAQLTSLSLTVSQGTSQTGTIILRNNGTADLTSVAIGLSSFTSGSNTLTGVSVSPTSTSTLHVNDVINLNVAANVPSSQATGTYTGTLTVDASGQQFTTSVTIIVTTASIVSVTMTPLTLQGVQGTTQTGIITLSNAGTVNLPNIAVSLSPLTSTSGTLTGVTIVPSLVSNLNGGSTINLNVVANIPSNQTIGGYSGTVTATVNGQQYTTSLIVNVLYAVITYSFSANDLTFAPQDGSNGRGKTLTTSLHIFNDGNQPLNLSLSSTLSSIYDARISNSHVTLNPGLSTDIPITLTVPTSQVIGATQLLSGGIIISSPSASLSKMSNVYISTPDLSAGMLEIYDVVLDVDGKTTSLDRNQTYNKLKPGVSAKLTVHVRNNYNGAKNIDINDVKIDVSSSGDLNIDESTYLNDLGNGDMEDYSVSTTVPSDAANGDDYNVNIHVTGKDADGLIYSDTFTATLKVQTTSHDISIKSFTLSPQTLACGGRTTAKATLENDGRYNENNVYLEVRSDSLGLDKNFTKYELSRDETNTQSYTFSIDNITSGNYEFTAISYYNDKESNEETLSLHVSPCQNEQAVSPNIVSASTNTLVTPTDTASSITPVAGNAVYNGTSFRDSPEYMIVLLAGVVLLLSLLIMVIVKAF